MDNYRKITSFIDEIEQEVGLGENEAVLVGGYHDVTGGVLSFCYGTKIDCLQMVFSIIEETCKNLDVPFLSTLEVFRELYRKENCKDYGYEGDVVEMKKQMKEDGKNE